MKLHSISLLASLCLALTACGDDSDSNTDTTVGATTAPATGDSDTAAEDTMQGDDGMDTMMVDSGGTNSCQPVDKTCPQACSQLYDCGVEAGCMFTGDAAEKMAFTAGCEANPLCDASAAAVNECDCAMTVATISSLSMDFTDSCENGISAGTGSSGGSGDSGGGSSTGG
ncbi:MAG: hypothetical protein JKY37_05050 [Nannocystaceae bacterium]|nr:hypothetical protein [Nannocystaceae bacterium]